MINIMLLENGVCTLGTLPMQSVHSRLHLDTGEKWQPSLQPISLKVLYHAPPIYVPSIEQCVPDSPEIRPSEAVQLVFWLEATVNYCKCVQRTGLASGSGLAACCTLTHAFCYHRCPH